MLIPPFNLISLSLSLHPRVVLSFPFVPKMFLLVSNYFVCISLKDITKGRLFSFIYDVYPEN